MQADALDNEDVHAGNQRECCEGGLAYVLTTTSRNNAGDLSTGLSHLHCCFSSAGRATAL